MTPVVVSLVDSCACCMFDSSQYLQKKKYIIVWDLLPDLQRHCFTVVRSLLTQCIRSPLTRVVGIV